MSDWSPERYKQLLRFSMDEEHGDILVDNRCSHCGKFITPGKVFSNMLGEVKFEGWHCHSCDKNSIPDWERVP